MEAEKRMIMFGGKGGVGKTTCAAAAALHSAKRGEKTLVISTDPTPSLADIFELRTSENPTEVTENLYLAELGTEEIRELWERKFGREVYEVFSGFVDIGYEEFVDFITSILPGLGEEFMVDYIRELARSGLYERIIWDTAPLGQTLELLRMPALLRGHLRAAPKIYSRLKLGGQSRRSVLEILKGWEELSGEDIAFLKGEVEFVMVTIPEALAVRQLAGAFAEFGRHGLSFRRLIINNVVREADSEFLRRKAQEQQNYLDLLHRSYRGLEILELPLFPYEIKGLARLAEVAEVLSA
ncbi:MAG: ArsA family ATPase [Candidatus Bipolaricaulia bacterium]